MWKKLANQSTTPTGAPYHNLCQNNELGPFLALILLIDHRSK